MERRGEQNSLQNAEELLIDHGTDVNAVDKEGRTPRDLTDYEDIIELLEKSEEEEDEEYPHSPFLKRNSIPNVVDSNFNKNEEFYARP